jgi:hypothetical protein
MGLFQQKRCKRGKWLNLNFIEQGRWSGWSFNTIFLSRKFKRRVSLVLGYDNSRIVLSPTAFFDGAALTIIIYVLNGLSSLKIALTNLFHNYKHFHSEFEQNSQWNCLQCWGIARPDIPCPIFFNILVNLQKETNLYSIQNSLKIFQTFGPSKSSVQRRLYHLSMCPTYIPGKWVH